MRHLLKLLSHPTSSSTPPNPRCGSQQPSLINLMCLDLDQLVPSLFYFPRFWRVTHQSAIWSKECSLHCTWRAAGRFSLQCSSERHRVAPPCTIAMAAAYVHWTVTRQFMSGAHTGLLCRTESLLTLLISGMTNISRVTE